MILKSGGNAKSDAARSISKPLTPLKVASDAPGIKAWGAAFKLRTDNERPAAASSEVPRNGGTFKLKTAETPQALANAKLTKSAQPAIIPRPGHTWSPLAIADLARSGITSDQGAALGMFSVENARDIYPEFRIEPALVIPYFNLDGSPMLFQRDGERLHFCRVRYLEPPLNAFTQEALPKYGQPERSGSHIYLARTVAWTKVLNNPDDTLFVVEGEKKSARVALEGYSALGLGGCWMARQDGALEGIKNLDPDLARFAVPGREMVLALDGDTATNKMVAAAEGYLALELGQRRGAAVHAMRFPFDDEKRMGADDFLVKHGSEAFYQLANSAPKMGEADARVAELNQQYAVICVGNRAFVMRTEHDDVLNRRRLSFFPKGDFELIMANRTVANPANPSKRVALGKVWLEHPHRRQYENGMTLAPGREVPDGTFNLWQGFSVEPSAGDWSLLRTHIFENLCSGNSEWFDYLLNWMARLLQRPGEAGQVALVFRGGRGVGKGIVASNLGRLINDHFIHALQADHVTGKFNGHLKDCVLLFGDEAFFAGNPAHEKILNGLITENTRLSEQKFQNAVTVPNYVHLILSTNSEWAIPAAIDERRYFVLDVPDHAHKQDSAYFGAIAAQMDGGGLAAMLHELQHRDISEFDVRRVPQTAALADQKRHTIHNRGGTLAWLQDVLTAGAIKHMGDPPVTVQWRADGLLVSRNDLFDAYVEWERKRPGRAHPDSREAFGRKLLGCLGTTFQGGDNVRLPSRVSRDRPRAYAFASLEDCREAFRCSQNMPTLWSADDV